MDAWSSEPIPPTIHTRTHGPLERHGALRFFKPSSVHNCHFAEWPRWAARTGAGRGCSPVFTEDQLIRQVIQGGGNMPALWQKSQPRPRTTALWWRFSKLYTRQIRNRRAMLLRAVTTERKARSRHGRHGYCPSQIARLSGGYFCSRSHRRLWLWRGFICAVWHAVRSAFPNLIAGWRLAAFFEWPRLSVACGRVSTRHIRSSTTHDSHAEAPSVDDRRSSP